MPIAPNTTGAPVRSITTNPPPRSGQRYLSDGKSRRTRKSTRSSGR